MSEPGLVEQLQIGALDGRVPLDDLLRKAKLAAFKLRTESFGQWAGCEMNGYQVADTLPEYRQMPGQVRFLNRVHGWRPILGLPNQTMPCYQSVSHIAAIIKESDGSAQMSIDDALLRMLWAETGLKTDMRFCIALASLSGLLETVRNTVLDWTIKLEMAGISGEGLSFSNEEIRAAQAMTTQNVFNGPIASVAQGGSFVSGVAQYNANSSQAQLIEAISALLAVVGSATISDPGARGAIEILETERDGAKQGRMFTMQRVKAALDLIRTSEDIALKVPEVAHQLHQLGISLGIA